MSRPASLTAKLKKADTELRNYIIELEKENLKLQQQIAKLQVTTVSQQNEIKALKKAPPKIKVVLGKPPDKSDSK